MQRHGLVRIIGHNFVCGGELRYGRVWHLCPYLRHLHGHSIEDIQQIGRDSGWSVEIIDKPIEDEEPPNGE